MTQPPIWYDLDRRNGKMIYRLRLSRQEYVGIKHAAASDHVRLDADGNLLILGGFEWDGPSGPAIDTPSFMRASLVHDALYRLITERKLPKRYRKDADKIMRVIAENDGMPFLRRWYAYAAVRVFGRFHL